MDFERWFYNNHLSLFDKPIENQVNNSCENLSPHTAIVAQHSQLPASNKM